MTATVEVDTYTRLTEATGKSVVVRSTGEHSSMVALKLPGQDTVYVNLRELQRALEAVQAVQ